MASPETLYDLNLLLDPQTDEERRAKIVADIEQMIDATGELVSRHEWGVRPTAYEVRKRPEADYHLLQFHGPSVLLEQLDHSLKITDGVLRFRIIRLRPGTPPPPEVKPPGVPVEAEA